MSEPLHTTFRLLEETGTFCHKGIRVMEDALGPKADYGLDRPIPILVVMRALGFRASVKALEAVPPEQHERAMAVKYRVRGFYEALLAMDPNQQANRS